MLRPARFRVFLRELSALVEREADEYVLLSQARSVVTELVAHDDWLPPDYQQPDPNRYQQYLLYCDPQERFSVVSFVWGPGQSTPVHNHETWGVIGILSGAEISQRFRLSEGALTADGPPVILHAGDVETLSPTTGDIHQVRNGLETEPSVTIHVYGADIGSVCRSIFATDGTRRPFISRYAYCPLPNFWLADEN